MSATDVIHRAGVLVQPGTPFGGHPLPPTVDALTVRITVGELTVLNAPPHHPEQWRSGARGTVLLVPGFAGSKEDFLPVLDQLAADGWDVWALSLRGQADSVAPGGDHNYRMDDFVTDLLQVADIVGDGAPVHLVGHSFGGLVARAAAILLPQAVASLTLLSSGPKCWTEEIRDLERAAREQGSLGLWEAQNADYMGRLLMDPVQEFGRFRASRTSTDCLVGILTALIEEPDRTAELLRLGIPTLVAHGTEDDGWPQHWQEVMARALGAEYAVIDGAGHLATQDNPGETAALFSDFFDRAAAAPGRRASAPFTPPSGSALDPAWQAQLIG